MMNPDVAAALNTRLPFVGSIELLAYVTAFCNVHK
ncbi:hypothetical protein HD597_000069 [Nonomuraea thailandensis]|uniref:Uncharacterized protein n=1 Tax=Nonomuraea thailandensis TaxID=1188745 RepID=A0A9X2JYE6_9ACTN|nr:hypothetical protein [Nonomuraea thailandensis]